MKIIMYIELNVFALIILLLIYLNIHHRSEKYLTEQKIFLALISSISLILFIDTLMWSVEGRTEFFIRPFFIFITLVYYILNPFVSMLWLFYSDYIIYRNEKHLKKLIIPITIPFLVNAVFSVLSIFNNPTINMFYIDQHNFYHRGTFFPLMPIISYLYFIYAIFSIIVNRNKLEKRTFNSIIIFALPPSVCGIIQLAFYGISVIWISMTISTLIIFINIQNNQLYIDHLTSLFNRRQLDYYLQERIQRGLNKKLLAGIMIDLNNFKAINDVYGHAAGDQALKDTAQILKNSFSKNDFIARYGGDEFVIILETDDTSSLTNTINQLRANVNSFNLQKKTPYEIAFSLGVDYYDTHSTMSATDFLKIIDHLMYQDKNKKI